MCGFAGILTSDRLRYPNVERVAEQMAGTLLHRGPDDGGTWADEGAGIALGFRRLSIIDLSAHGHQPMRSASGRFSIVFNGEIFNHAVLRSELEGSVHFRGHSDTEVMLAAFERWGVEASVRRFLGMFAFAVWDAQARTLTLARDRMGIKPLFVGVHAGTVSFGSELKALMAAPGFDRAIDADALTDYLRYLFVPAPRTIFRSTMKLQPGHLLTLRDPAAPLPDSRAYWSVAEAAQRGLEDPFTGGEEEAVEALDTLLLDATRLRMEADVPLGAFLSGGIDSSTVVSLMQALSSQRVKTYSIGFREPEYNEATYAAAIARHLGTDHTELTVTAEDALRTVPRLATLYDEPFADPSQIPTLLVSAMARQHVTVALSGDGGDEVFGGYNRYVYGRQLFERMLRVPRPARAVVAAGIQSVSSSTWDRAHRAVEPILPPTLRQRLPGQKLQKFGYLLGSATAAAMYRSLVSVWQNPEQLVINATGRDRTIEDAFADTRFDLLNRMLLADQQSSLADDQLAKVDRASMGVSLEVRVPLLDHRVVEFSWRLPAHLKVRDGITKYLLRQVLYKRVPRALIDRPKMGFSVPVGPWLRGPLRDWAGDLLAPAALDRTGLLSAPSIQAAWQQVRQGHDELALGLWAVLMFQAWQEQWLA